MSKGLKDLELKELAGTEPKLEQLREEFLWAVQRRDSNVFARQRLNYTSRYCIWAGQTMDGRKWGAKDNEPFPWQGASDARVHLIDGLINEDVAKLMVVWRRSPIQANAARADSEKAGTLVSQLLRWQVKTQMKEARKEAKFAANYMLERGTAVVGCWWEKAMQLGYDNVDLETIKAISMEAQQSGALGTARPTLELPEGVEIGDVVSLPGLIMDPSSEKKAAEIASRIYSDMALPALRQAVRDLREKGSARFVRPYLKENRPRIWTGALNEDIFLPPEATGIDSETTALDRRELLSETTLRSRVQSHGWDKGWVEEVIKTQRGRISCDFDGNLLRRGTAGLMTRGIPDLSRLFEVVHAYRRQGDENGVPGIYCTYYSPGLIEGARARSKGMSKSAYAWHGLLDYDHGELPFVLFERENRTRLVDDSRGYGEIASTWQQQVKGEWDGRLDRASITTCPPFYYPIGEPPDRWGPGVRLPTHRPEDYGFLKTPAYDPMSKEVEGTVERFARRYFGRVVDEENVVEAGAMQQETADNWMAGWGKVYTQILQLDQQYMPDEIYFRVVGSSKGKPIHTTRDEIQGEFDVSVGMSIEDLDPAKVKEKIGLLESVLQMDVNGRIDRDEAINYVFELVDPSVGERLLQSGEDASQKQVEETKAEFAQLLLGIPVDVKPSGQAYRLKQQVAAQLMQQNPKAQQAYQGDEQVRTVIDRYAKMLQFQIEQHEVNPMVGKLGAR
jgi:hypothetical protein